MPALTPRLEYKITAELRPNGGVRPRIMINRTLEFADRDGARQWLADEAIKHDAWVVALHIDELGLATQTGGVLYLPAPAVPPCTYKASGGMIELWPVKLDRHPIKILKEDKT